jgi:ABC-2 type transport system permease protein
MKTFAAFVIKEFKHIFRDYRTLMVLFGMPVAQVLLFGNVISTEIKNAKIAVLDHSQSEASHQLTAKLFSSGYFINAIPVYSMHDVEEGFKNGEIKMAIVFPTTFNRDVLAANANIQIIADASEPNTAVTLVNYAKAIVQNSQKQFGELPVLIESRITMHYNPLQLSVYLFVPGVITIILTLISAMLTAIAITREKELGNLEILLVSPLNPAIIVLGKVVPYMVLSLINASFILLTGYLVFGVPVFGSVWLLFLEVLLFIICVLSLGVVISIISTSQQMALMISLMVFMLPTILLSGFIFPIRSMPWPLQLISNILPAKYFIIIIKGIMLKGVGIKYFWKETLVLAGMTIFFIGISIKKFKIRLA